jgi:hypothetical protein
MWESGDVPAERIASNFSIEERPEKTVPRNRVCSNLLSVLLDPVDRGSTFCENLVNLYQIIRCHIPKGNTFQLSETSCEGVGNSASSLDPCVGLSSEPGVHIDPSWAGINKSTFGRMPLYAYQFRRFLFVCVPV